MPNRFSQCANAGPATLAPEIRTCTAHHAMAPPREEQRSFTGRSTRRASPPPTYSGDGTAGRAATTSPKRDPRSRSARNHTTPRSLKQVFRGRFSSATPCEGGAMVSFCTFMAWRTAPPSPGTESFRPVLGTARRRDGETARRVGLIRGALLHRAIRYPISTNRSPRGPATNLQMPGLFRFSNVSEGSAAPLRCTARAPSPRCNWAHKDHLRRCALVSAAAHCPPATSAQ
jgi:hypothetical protein